MNGQLIIDRYMEELNAELENMPDVERENAIDELKGHITAFVQDRIKAGLSEEELQEAVESEFSHPKELAELMMGDGERRKGGGLYWAKAGFRSFSLSRLSPCRCCRPTSDICRWLFI